jgi:hypothetical protein
MRSIFEELHLDSYDVACMALVVSILSLAFSIIALLGLIWRVFE